MRRLALGCIGLFFIVFACSLMRGQTAIYDCYNGSSEQGGNNAVTNGIQSTNFVQQSFPGATVTVFLHNSATKASIFSDEFGLNALANPFSSSNHGVAFICAADGRYDIQYSNGGIASPYTVSDIRLCFSCTGGGGGGSGGSFKTVPNCSAAPTVLNETVQEASQTVAGATQTCATVGATSSTSIIGLCTSAGVCGSTGNAAVATQNTANCIFDNAATQGDYVVPSTSVTGWCSDAGAVKPSSAVETLGNVFQANTGGSGTIGVVQVAPLSLLLPGATGNTGVITPCTGTGCVAFFPNANQALIQGDTLFTTNGVGTFTALGGQFVDTAHSGEWFTQKGPALPALSATNSMYWATGTSFGTTYGLEPFDSAPTAGDCISIVAGDATNWFKLHDAGAACGTGAGATFQVNAVNTSSQTTINFQNSFDMTFANPSAGNIQVHEIGDGQLGTPSIPTATVNGTPASTDYKYAVVGCQDIGCAYHTAISPVVDVPTGAATITGVNSITLKGYGDTFYGIRGYLICRTSSSGTPSSVGILTGSAASPLLAWKSFIDTGLTADGSNCATLYASNTTLTQPVCLGSALPGIPSTPGFPCGVDGMPLTPNAADDECTQSFGSIGDTNDPFWTLVNFGSATGTWSNGACILISDTTASNNLEMMTQTLPSTPYTYIAQISMKAISTFGGCAVGFRESSSGKVSGVLNYQNVALSVGTASPVGHGMSTFTGTNATTLTLVSTNNYMGDQYYYKIKNDGTNLTYSYSPDGVDYRPYPNILDSTTWTSAPNQLFVAVNSAATTASCAIDFVRRTQ